MGEVVDVCREVTVTLREYADVADETFDGCLDMDPVLAEMLAVLQRRDGVVGVRQVHGPYKRLQYGTWCVEYDVSYSVAGALKRLIGEMADMRGALDDLQIRMKSMEIREAIPRG